MTYVTEYEDHKALQRERDSYHQENTFLLDKCDDLRQKLQVAIACLRECSHQAMLGQLSVGAPIVRCVNIQDAADRCLEEIGANSVEVVNGS